MAHGDLVTGSRPTSTSSKACSSSVSGRWSTGSSPPWRSAWRWRSCCPRPCCRCSSPWRWPSSACRCCCLLLARRPARAVARLGAMLRGAVIEAIESRDDLRPSAEPPWRRPALNSGGGAWPCTAAAGAVRCAGRRRHAGADRRRPARRAAARHASASSGTITGRCSSACCSPRWRASRRWQPFCAASPASDRRPRRPSG